MVVNPALLTRMSTVMPSSSSRPGSSLREPASVMSAATTSARTWWVSPSSSASALRRSSRRATRVTPWPRRASSRAISAPMPEEDPVTSAVVFSLGVGSAIADERSEAPEP